MSSQHAEEKIREYLRFRDPDPDQDLHNLDELMRYLADSLSLAELIELSEILGIRMIGRNRESVFQRLSGIRLWITRQA